MDQKDRLKLALIETLNTSYISEDEFYSLLDNLVNENDTIEGFNSSSNNSNNLENVHMFSSNSQKDDFYNTQLMNNLKETIKIFRGSLDKEEINETIRNINYKELNK